MGSVGGERGGEVRCGYRFGGGMEKCVGVWEVRRDMGEERGRAFEVWRKVRRDVGKCWGTWS